MTAATQLRGLGLPALRLAGGYFVSKTRYDVTWGDMMLAVFTPIGTRVGNRQFGSALYQILHEPLDEGNSQLADYIIRDAVSKWVPHVRISAVDVRPIDNGLSMSISFSLRDESTVETRTARVSASNLSALLPTGV